MSEITDKAIPECITMHYNPRIQWVSHDWHEFSAFEVPFKCRTFQINHTNSFWMLPWKVAYVESSLEFGTELTFISLWLWQLWKDMKKRQISPCKDTLLYPQSHEPAERSWDQYIPNKRLDLVYTNKCQGVSLWISKSVIDLGCYSDI